MDTSTLHMVVVVVACFGLLFVDGVTTLPLQPCSLLVNHVDFLVAADQPLSADHLRLYLACLGVDRPQIDEAAERQLIDLQPNSAAVNESGTSATVADEVCASAECLGRRAAMTFEPCSHLTQAQCVALISVLDNIISTNSDTAVAADDDNDAAAARLLEHFRQIVTLYRKWRQSDVTTDQTRPKRRGADEAEEAAKRGTRSRHDIMTSSRVISGAGGRRMRRSTVPRGIPFRLPERMTPEARAIIDAYLEWRSKNGYGRVSGRWG